MSSRSSSSKESKKAIEELDKIEIVFRANLDSNHNVRILYVCIHLMIIHYKHIFLCSVGERNSRIKPQKRPE